MNPSNHQLKAPNMTFLQRYACYATLIGLGLAAANGAYAQVTTINSVRLSTREFNDFPGSTLTVFNAYPSIIYFDDKNVSAPSGFANRHVWRFSNDLGATAYQLQNDEFFKVSMTLTLTGNPTSPRKEAGFLFDTIGGQGQFIVNTDHEIVAFGGPLPFYAFPSTFNSGDTITLGMTYVRVNGTNSIIYSANGVNSPILRFSNTELGIITGSTLGGYLQVVNGGLGNPSNTGTATFQNISIVPEPSTLALLCLGILPLGIVLRRRR